jgi:hypothetical protein
MLVRVDLPGMGSDESLVKTSLEMMSSPPVTIGMTSNASVNSVATP